MRAIRISKVRAMTWIRLSFPVALPFAALSLVAGGVAVAGNIDGSWCAEDGRRISVDGLAVMTPGGQPATGRYTARAFTFVLPAGEWQAGAEIWMEPKGSDAVRVSTLETGHQGPPPHGLWRRCRTT